MKRGFLISVVFLLGLIPKANAQGNQTVDAGKPTTAAVFPSAGCLYNWVNDNPGIGLPASGTGDIASFTAVNAGNSPVKANITATPVPSGFAYIANWGSNNVSIVSTANNSVVKTISVGANPFGVYVSNDQKRVYVANILSNTVSVINTATNTIDIDIPVGQFPYSVCTNPDGSRLYVVNNGDKNVSVINTANNTLITNINVGDSPYAMAINPAGTRVYVTHEIMSNSVISVINTSNNQVIANISVGVGPEGVVVSPDGNLVYITNVGADQVTVINANNNQIIKTIAVGTSPEGIGISPDGSRIYTANFGSNNVSVINTVTGQVVATVNVGSGPTGVNVSPDGSFVYATNLNSNTVSVINASTNILVSNIPVGTTPDSQGSFITAAGNCSPVTFTITVNPAAPPPAPGITVSPASGNIFACVGAASASPDIEQFTVSGSSLTGPISVAAPIGFEVSPAPGNGYGNTLTIAQSSGTAPATIVYIRSAITNTPGNISGNVILTSAGYAGLSVTVKGNVAALPTVNKVPDQTLDNGALANAVNFTGTGLAYNWTNDKPGIGLAAGGTGNIAPFTAVNTGSTPVTAKITVTPVPPAIAYINNSGDGTVSAINTATRAVMAVIRVGQTPIGIAASPDGTRVYVENEDSSTISVINTATNSVIATIDVSPYSRGGLEVSPDGSRLYLATFGGDEIKVINTITNTVIATVAGGHLPLGTALSPDGGTLYVGNFEDGTVSVFNTATNTIVSAIVVGPGSQTGTAPMDLVVTPDGKTLYIAAQSPDAVYAIDAATHTVKATIPLGLAADGIAISPDGSHVYATSQYANTVTVINTANNTIATTIRVPDAPAGISVTPDGRQVYVTSPEGVTVINAETNSVVTTFAAGAGPHSFGDFIIKGPGCSGIPTTFNITVKPSPTPLITATAPPPVNTIYGTASAPGTFNVSGSNITAGIQLTAPTGFEISTDNISFSNTATIGNAGNIANIPVYIRLSAVTPAGTYAGNITLTSNGAPDVPVQMPNSTVSPAPLTITVNNAIKTYGDALSGDGPTGTFTATGLQNQETIGTVTLIYGAGAPAPAAAGTYPDAITLTTASGGTFNAGNYAITYGKADIIVNKAILTIAADNKTKTVGDVNPPLTVTYSGFVNNEGIRVLTTQPLASTTATIASMAGVYPITAGGAASDNYTFNYVDGTLTVNNPVLALQIPNTFTPNGDGINDTWNIKNIDTHPDCTVSIFTRYGAMVFTSIGYGKAWDGKYEGSPVPSGTYYYLIDLKNNTTPLSGSLAVIR